MAGVIANNFGSLPVVFKKGKGVVLTDVADKKYIDFVAGIGVNCLGHGHASLTKAIAAQAEKQIHISNYYNSDTALAYVEKLLSVSKMERVFFGNSGAEANEAAIKLARKYGYLVGTGDIPLPAEYTGNASEKSNVKRNVIVTLEKSFHGRTITTLKATGQDKFHPECFAPYPDGFRHIPANDYNALENAFDDSVCAVLIECVQGEGGVNLIDADWAKACALAARKAGALVMADEVQTGIGRTGTFFASEQLGFNPDVITTAKGIAGGIPMGACLYRGKAADVFVAGDHQSTFGGNPLACAAATVVIDELLKPGFLEKVRENGEYIRSIIKNWKFPCIKEIRGKGLMIGIDIDRSSADIQKACLCAEPEGLCISTAGAQTLRFLPPLIIEKKEIDIGLSILKSVLENAHS